MKNDDTREQLILATINLLTRTKDAAQITSRQIAAEAKANLAMINYCFKSKEALVNIAIGRIISNAAKDFVVAYDDSISPKEHLKRILYNICDITISYSKFTKVTIPYILLHGDITHPFDVLPTIQKHFGSKKSNSECRVIAYQMISFMQLIFLRSEDFCKYSGIDIYNTDERNKFIDMQLNLFLGDEQND